MTSPTIRDYIPHREPMLLVDEIVRLDERQIVCIKRFRADEFFVQGHYPGYPIVPGVILCEAVMQAGAILLAAHFQQVGDDTLPMTERAEFRAPVATRMNEVKFKRVVRPGDMVQIEATLREQISEAYFLSGKVILQEKVAARLDFACTLAGLP